MDDDVIEQLKEALFAARTEAPFTAAAIPGMRQGLAAAGAANPPAGDIIVAGDRLAGRPVLRVAAPGAQPDRLVYYLHGGGYVAGEPAGYTGLLGELSRASGAHVLALDFAKAPEHPFPAAYDDAFAGLTELQERGAAFAVAGDSAGGGLALAMLQAAARRGGGARAGFLIGPWADLSLQSPSIRDLVDRDPLVSGAALTVMARMYAPKLALRDARISPLFGSFEGLPPLLIQVGSDELLLDDALRVDRLARAAGVQSILEVWPRMIHVWHLQTARLPQAHQALRRAGAFLRERLSA